MQFNSVYANSCGKIENFFSISQLKKTVETFNRLQTTGYDGNKCFGINQKHFAYPWAKLSLIDPITKEFNVNFKLIFAMFLDCVVPFPIHHDLKELPENDGKHFLSFLIPYSVNNDISKCQHASTLIFNESYDDLNNLSTTQVSNNFSEFHETKISHVPKDTSYAVSLKKEFVWSPGDLLWWDSELLHVSNNFIKDGYTSKQGIVLHTYVL